MSTSMLAHVITKVADGIATYLMADVIAIVADGIATWLECVQVDLIAFVADGKTTESIYFNFSSLLLIQTSSHT